MKGPSEIVRDSWGVGKVEFERSRDFPVVAGRLFSYLADLRNLPAWREEVRKVRRVPGGRKKPGPGDSCVLDVDRGGDQVEVRVEISRFEQDSLLEFRVESETYRALETYRFEEAVGGTRVKFSFHALEPGFLVRTLALLVGSTFRADLDKKLDALKAAFEERPRRKKSSKERLKEYSAPVRARLQPQFEAAGVSYPPGSVVLVGLKNECRLEVYAGAAGGAPAFVCSYPVLGASGSAGPKLREGDQQVPEGIYAIEELNPNSRYHLSLRVGYPNELDRARGEMDGRDDLGGDIMIHGGDSSVGCLAMGDQAAEDLFVLAADCGCSNLKLILTPVDFRRRELPLSCWALPAWTEELYAGIRKELAELPRPGS
ncbi:MAG: SRPBCC family protein [Planctomycetota bacterium]